MDTRSQWGTRAGFIMAAVGSAIGLGNIWRFPAVAYENGGGAFIIPYLFALLTAGIPILIMEFTLGHKYRGSAPLSYKRLNKKTEFVGWWAVLVAFVISTYYSVIIAWAISYSVFSFNLSWGSDTEGFLMNDFLNRTVDPGQAGSLVPGVLIPLIIVWIVVLGILFKGVKRGIEVANRIFIPALVIIFLIIVIRAVTLDGALAGLEAFFSPDFSKIWSGEVWVAAYGQIFFSLSIAFAIMITYSSYLPKKSDITNNAFITGFGNSSFELLAGIGVFSVLGFMATQSGVGVDEVVSGGVGLAFVVFPAIINEFPGLNGLFGFLFFASLVLAGLTSLMSITETYIAGLVDKFKISRTKAVLFGGGTAAIISLLFATQGGLYFLDAADYFINQFGVALVGLVEVVLIAWILREVKNIKAHADEVSDIRLGWWWTLSLNVITPIVLGYMMFDLFRQNLMKQFDTPTGNYEGYPDVFILYGGWAVAAAALIIGVIMSLTKWKQNGTQANQQSDKREAK
ncbi:MULTISPECIES: sodium-dependent transporter [Virgibacillus]|uniref:Na+-dependent transporters of the SNF family protein n=2 Tax=Virgibacillus TaxID=84406 RepID=A0A024QA82_9BACI|nr:MULTISPECIES: sodium-dependent transporter [Virgibacillus]EQB37314.1 transporter [Virgibacillus sp. CM-4]MYL40070.1 sodium-dependent transporter [Virgibacillus massiliensis]GGJ62385.1 transporter [Virgibacillus kapii]CDQ39187.1 Na+-dependent transporters of the SNF family protein [Virgibacillus massiliensis]